MAKSSSVAPSKRKRSSHPTDSSPTRSRPKIRELAPSSQSASAADNEEYPVRQILAEDPKLGYFVEWARHPVTGETYPPSWEPCRNLNAAAIKDWVEIAKPKIEKYLKAESDARKVPTKSARKPTRLGSVGRSVGRLGRAIPVAGQLHNESFSTSSEISRIQNHQHSDSLAGDSYETSSSDGPSPSQWVPHQVHSSLDTDDIASTGQPSSYSPNQQEPIAVPDVIPDSQSPFEILTFHCAAPALEVCSGSRIVVSSSPSSSTSFESSTSKAKAENQPLGNRPSNRSPRFVPDTQSQSQEGREEFSSAEPASPISDGIVMPIPASFTSSIKMDTSGTDSGDLEVTIEDVSHHSVEHISLESAERQSSDTSSTSLDLIQFLRDGNSVARPGEYYINMPMTPLARSEYMDTIRYNRDLIKEFIHGPSLVERRSLPSDLDKILKFLEGICTHFDLVQSIPSQDNSQQPTLEWHRTISTKFMFLIHLLTAMRDAAKTLLVVCSEGKLTDMVATLVDQLDVRYRRTDQDVSSEGTGAVSVIVMPSNELDPTAYLQQADLIIAIDRSVSNSPIWKFKASIDADLSSPAIVHLVSVDSVEHVYHSILPDTSVDKHLALVALTAGLMNTAGKLEDVSSHAEQIQYVKYLADQVAHFVIEGADWALGDLKLIDLTETGMESLPAFSSSAAEQADRARSANNKRSMSSEDEDGPSKKVRMSPPLQATQAPGPDGPDILDDTIASADTGSLGVHELQEMLASMQAGHKRDVKKLISCDAVIRAAQDDARDRRDGLARVQTEMAAMKQAHEVELKSMQDRLTRQEAMLDSRQERIRKLEEEVSSLAAIVANGQAGVEHGASTTSELANPVELRKRAENAERDAAYARERYQDASMQASQLAEEAESLRGQLTTASKQASGQMTEARRITAEQAEKSQSNAVTELQAQVAGLEQLVRRKDELIKQLKERPGVGTRASSVPKSPRIGGSVRSGSESRAVSPGSLAAALVGGRVGALRDERI